MSESFFRTLLGESVNRGKGISRFDDKECFAITPDSMFGSIDESFGDSRASVFNRFLKDFAGLYVCPRSHQDHFEFGQGNNSKEDSQSIVDGKYQIDLNVDGFAPKEVDVSIQGNIVSVSAKHEEKKDGICSSKQVFRQFSIPSNVDSSQIRAHVNESKRRLSIEAPLLNPDQSKGKPSDVEIDIRRM